jgi:hypothetical protein
MRTSILGSPLAGAAEDRQGSGTRGISLSSRLFRFQNRNSGYYQQVTTTETSKKLLLLFGSLVFMLLFAEGLLRFFPLLRPLPRTYVGEYDNRQEKHHFFLVPDPLVGWKMRPKASEFNAQRFRAPSDFHQSQACKGIAFAGDSFTFGVGVRYEKTFASLTQAGVPGSCAYNMGIPGFGLDQIWLTVLTQALPLHPQLVVVSFISDDLTRSEQPTILALV